MQTTNKHLVLEPPCRLLQCPERTEKESLPPNKWRWMKENKFEHPVPCSPRPEAKKNHVFQILSSAQKIWSVVLWFEVGTSNRHQEIEFFSHSWGLGFTSTWKEGPFYFLRILCLDFCFYCPLRRLLFLLLPPSPLSSSTSTFNINPQPPTSTSTSTATSTTTTTTTTIQPLVRARFWLVFPLMIALKHVFSSSAGNVFFWAHAAQVLEKQSFCDDSKLFVCARLIFFEKMQNCKNVWI